MVTKWILRQKQTCLYLTEQKKKNIYCATESLYLSWIQSTNIWPQCMVLGSTCTSIGNLIINIIKYEKHETSRLNKGSVFHDRRCEIYIRFLFYFSTLKKENSPDIKPIIIMMLLNKTLSMDYHIKNWFSVSK